MTTVMKEYYSDPETVASAVHRFMNITVDEMNNTKIVNRNFRVMTSEILQREGVDTSLLDNMNYTDLITMLEMSKDSKYTVKYNKYSDEICTSEVYNLFIYKVLLLIILEAAKNAIPIRLFLELPLQAFYAYIENVKGGKEQHNDYAVIGNEIERLHGEFKKDISIKELLMKAREKVCKDWGIVDKPIDEYKQMVFDELMLVKRVLALTFMEVFPERFTLFEEDVKYAKIRADYEEGGDK